MLTIKFVIGEIYKEPELNWKELPNEVIRYIEYKFNNRAYRMIGFEKYLRLKEYTYGINVPLKEMTEVILAGCNADVCTVLTFNMKTLEVKKEKRQINEIYNGKPIDEKYWKKGEKLEQSAICVNYLY